MSKARLAELVNVTRRTVANWMRYFSQPYEFKGYQVPRKLSYFPHVVKGNLGLKIYTVFFMNPKWELAYICPNRNFIGRLYDVESNSPVLAMECLVPKGISNEFKEVLEAATDYGLCSRIECYETGASFVVYSPFHEVVDQNGIFHYERNKSGAVEQNILKLRSFFSQDYEVQMHSSIKKNPLLIPILGENMFELKTTPELWTAMKERLGEDIWKYFDRQEKRSNGIGITRVQQAKILLHSMNLITQMRVVYFPFEIGHNFWIWSILKYANLTQLLDTVTKIVEHSILVNVRRVERNLALVSYLLNGKAYQDLFTTLVEQKIQRTMIYDYSQWEELVTTTRYSVFDYAEMFDPEGCRWVLNIEVLRHNLQTMGEAGNR